MGPAGTFLLMGPNGASPWVTPLLRPFGWHNKYIGLDEARTFP